MATTVPLMNIQPSTDPLTIANPNGMHMTSTHEGDLPLDKLPTAARLAHRVPQLEKFSLLFIPQLCDAGCEVLFKQGHAEISYNNEVLYVAKRDPALRLWILDIQSDPPAARFTSCRFYH